MSIMKDTLEDKLEDILENKEIAEQASYEDEVSSKRTVTISLKEYDELKSEQHFITDPSLISIIDKVEELIRALRKHIIRKWQKEFVLWQLWEKTEEN